MLQAMDSVPHHQQQNHFLQLQVPADKIEDGVPHAILQRFNQHCHYFQNTTHFQSMHISAIPFTPIRQAWPSLYHFNKTHMCPTVLRAHVSYLHLHSTSTRNISAKTKNDNGKSWDIISSVLS